ncbi:DNA gyrase subunit A [Candidatus Woesearchaeota archaeon]|nr:DNA gyrase subunit A [Candidatus Woesearchaeota archaeon]
MNSETTKAAVSILNREISQEMKTSYLDYAMSVLVARALPDLRDGLKPVQRRVLYAMYHDLGLLHNKQYRKSARIIGDCLGKYHPHSESAVYDTMVRMAQDFSLRYPLIDGQGNWGSIDGDSAAAIRYTEARLSRIAEELLIDIEKETVDFVPNFDASLEEPLVLPSKIPNLLINGSSGIAVGMATNIPPHNFKEVADAVIATIKNPEICMDELMHHIKGPDFPTGGIICGNAGIRQAYKTGRGLITIRAKISVEKNKDRQRMIVNEIPFQVNKSQLIEEMADLIREKKIQGISDLRDESDKEGLRIVIELKKDANQEVVMNQLFTHTKLETTFGIMMIALQNNEPRTLDLKEVIQSFIRHRQHVVRRRTSFELKKAEEKAHILQGIIIALKNIENVIILIRKSRDAAAAKTGLISQYSISDKQASAILEIKLQRLASLEQEKVKLEFEELTKLINHLKEILSDDKRILEIIENETTELKQKYSDPRRTEIGEGVEDFEIEDLIPSQDAVVTITHNGYIKRLSLDAYRQQKRGGKGIIAAEIGEQDFVESIFYANTHSYILFFTDKGIAHWLKVYKIPEASRLAMGKAIVNLLDLEDEKITAYIPVKEFDGKYGLLMSTKNGVIKKTSLSEYSKPRKGGIISITLDENDKLVGVELTEMNREVIIATKNGLAARFNESDVRETGRSSQGVRGIRLKSGDEVIGMVVAEKSLLTITENGYGKRTKVDEYRLINRGGLGVINIQTNERNGKVAVIKSVSESDDLMIISKKGIGIRITAKDISEIGRNTQGVRIMKLDQNDKVVAAAIVPNEGNNHPA